MLNKRLLLKWTKNRTKGLNLSIREPITNKKLYYEGGCGYDKLNQVFLSFIKDNINNNISNIDISNCGEIDIERFNKFLNNYNLEISVNIYDKYNTYFYIGKIL